MVTIFAYLKNHFPPYLPFSEFLQTPSIFFTDILEKRLRLISALAGKCFSSSFSPLVSLSKTVIWHYLSTRTYTILTLTSSKSIHPNSCPKTQIWGFFISSTQRLQSPFNSASCRCRCRTAVACLAWYLSSTTARPYLVDLPTCKALSSPIHLIPFQAIIKDHSASIRRSIGL